MPTKNSFALFKSTIVVSLTLFAARILGFARESVLAAAYGASEVSDAFIIAYTIPSIAFGFVSASVVSAYIPMVNRSNYKARFTNNLLTHLLILGLSFSGFLMLFPKSITHLFASQLDGNSFSIAVYLVQLMIWSAAPIVASDILRACLQTEDLFVSAGISGSLVSAIVIVGITISKETDCLLLLGISPVVGNLVCLLFLLLACAKNGYVYRPYLRIGTPEIKEIILFSSPMILSNAASQLNQIVDRNFASSLAVGTIASLNYANKVVGIATAMTGLALYTVLFPKMSELFASGKLAALKELLSRGIIAMIVVLLPVTLGAILLAEPLIKILFERGSFSSADTVITAECFRMYALLIIPNSINPLLIRAFFSMEDARRPAIVSLLSLALNILLNFIMIRPMLHQGLALSTAIASLVSTALLLVFLRKKIGAIGFNSDIPELIRIVLSSITTAILAAIAIPRMPFSSAGIWDSLLLCMALTASSAAIYILLLLVMRSTVLLGFFRMLRATTH